MINRINRVLKVVLMVQLIMLGGMLFVKTVMNPQKLYASFDVGTPDIFKITIQKITLLKGVVPVVIFSGSKEVDIASVSSFQSALDIDCNVPAGEYTGVRVECSNTVQVRGRAILAGTTYYTKTAHTGYSAGPAEEEELEVLEIGSRQTFMEPMNISGQATLRLIVDIEKVLTYWDGNDDNKPTPEIDAAGMTIVPLPMALVIGTPGSREIYEVTDDYGDGGYGRLALIFDSNDNFMGGMGRAILTDSNTSSIFFTGGSPIQHYTIEENDTITIEQGETTNMSDNSTMNWTMTGFQRQNHTGNYEIESYGETHSGTYTATRLE